ncbi:protease, partial [Streptomyces sp. SID1328]|nr:protease [Streptomyces sp. SID1328]
MNEGHPKPPAPSDDFELAKPAAAAGFDGSRTGREPGDLRPAEPDRPAEPGGDEDAPAGDPLGGHGSYGGAPSSASETGDGGDADRSPAPGDGSAAEPPHGGTRGSRDEPRETAGDRPADPRADDSVSGPPKPLHDPDPYGTPPYGGPGPWAPAPPVQHPMATPAP